MNISPAIILLLSLIFLSQSIHIDITQAHDQGFERSEGPHYPATQACLDYLNTFIGNKNGELTFGGKNFSSNCQDISCSEVFSALALTATCQRTDNPDQYRTTTVTIKNFGSCLPPSSD